MNLFVALVALAGCLWAKKGAGHLFLQDRHRKWFKGHQVKSSILFYRYIYIYLHPSIFNELNIFVGPHSSILEFFDLSPSGQQGLIPNLAIHLQSMEERVSDARKETGLLDSRVMPWWGFEKRYPIAFGVTLFGYFAHSRKQICRGTEGNSTKCFINKKGHSQTKQNSPNNEDKSIPACGQVKRFLPTRRLNCNPCSVYPTDRRRTSLKTPRKTILADITRCRYERGEQIISCGVSISSENT